MSETLKLRLGVAPSSVTEWGWVSGRAIVGVVAAAVTFATSSPDEPAYWPTIGLIAVFLLYDVILAGLLILRKLDLVFAVGSILDNVLIVGGWWWTSYLSRNQDAAGDLYLILFPLMILGMARLGWRLGIVQMAIWVGVMAATGWLYSMPDSYAIQQLPIRIAILSATGVLAIQLASRLTAETDRARRSQAELQRTLADLKSSQGRLVEQERMRTVGEMATGIVHDINNGVMPIIGYAELLVARAENLTSEQRRQLESILRSGRDVAQILQRLRDFSRRREDGEAVSEQPVELNAVIRDVVELSRLRLQESRGEGVIQVRQRLASGLPLVRGNEAEFREAVLNLVINAIDAMPLGGVLTLSTRTRPSSGPHVHDVMLEVADTGSGMDEETLQKATQMFFTTKGNMGTGLGLSMVKSTVEEHGGTMELESQRGEGTTIRLVFPAVTQEA